MKSNKISLISIFVFLIVLLVQYIVLEKEFKNNVINGITQSSQAANITVSKLFINSVYPKLEKILKLEDEINPKEGVSGKDLQIVDNMVRNFMWNTDVLKLKVFALNGLTLYSTELKQINQSRSDNSAFISAKQGIVATQVTHKGKFSAIDKEVFKKDLISSYLPIYNKHNTVIGVLEIYTDRTPIILQSKEYESVTSAYIILFQIITFLIVLFIFWNLQINKTNTKKNK